VLIFLGSIVLKQLETMSCKKVMCVYAQFKKVTWNVYTHAQFSGGFYEDDVSIFILYKILGNKWWVLGFQENTHAYE